MYENKNCLLAFDLSTTTLGYAIFLIETKELLELDYYKFESESLLEKTEELECKIRELCAIYDIQIFSIEERLKSFQAGGSTADTITKLAAFNFYCQTIFYNQKIQIKEIPSATGRRLAIQNFHSIARKIKGKKQKEIAFEFIVKELGEDKFPKKIMKAGKNKGKEVFTEEARDMSDAYCIGKATLELLFPNIVG